jgi:hypothetical protein
LRERIFPQCNNFKKPFEEFAANILIFHGSYFTSLPHYLLSPIKSIRLPSLKK